jgi:hypothetical protein
VLPHDLLRLFDSEPSPAGRSLRAREKLFIRNPLNELPQHLLRQRLRGCALALSDRDQVVPQHILNLEFNHQPASFHLR